MPDRSDLPEAADAPDVPDTPDNTDEAEIMEPAEMAELADKTEPADTTEAAETIDCSERTEGPTTCVPVPAKLAKGPIAGQSHEVNEMFDGEQFLQFNLGALSACWN